jgi:protein gp37
MSDMYWKKLSSWNRKAAKRTEPTLVFCGSLCDVLDTNAPAGQRDRLWSAIAETPALTWLLLTKREGNLDLLPPTFPSNLWLGMTAENQEYLLRRGNALSKVKAAIRFLSVEPMLSPIDLRKLDDPKAIDWVICGCESKAGRRPMDIQWARDLKNQCAELGIRFFMKQAEIRGEVTDDIEKFPEDLRVRQYPLATAVNQ